MTEGIAHHKPTIGIRIGSVSVTGPAAIVALVLLLALVIAVVAWIHPRVEMIVTAVIWIGFTIYWSSAAKRSAPQQQTESRASRALHVRLLYLGLLLLFVPVPGLRARFIAATTPALAAGFAVQFGFLLLAVWARRVLGRNWSGAIAVAEEHQLIVSGPYRLIRHPIYTAIIGMAAGTAIVCGEIHALLGPIILFGAYLRKIPLEEQNLRNHFGPAYDEYSRRSRAVIPYVL